MPPEVVAKKEQHDKLAKELLATQEEYKGKDMPENVGADFEAKLREVEALWAEVEPHVKAAEVAARLEGNRQRSEAVDRVLEPTLPDDGPATSTKVAGYITLGDYVVSHPSVQAASDNGFKSPLVLTNINVVLNAAKRRLVRGPEGEPLVPLTLQERKEWEAKALPTIGAGVIEPQRLGVIPQVVADDRLRLRDVIMGGNTGSNAVSYIREESFTRAAAETAAGSAKPEAALQYTEQTANVRTIPVWIPVTTEQLADWPQLRSLIDGRLLYDIGKREEEQVMYGDGTGQNLEGLLVVSGTTDITASGIYTAGDPLIEKIGVGVTEVRVSGYEANAVLIHPYDWHSVVTAKGSDDHFLGQVWMAEGRQPRAWSVAVVETVAAQANDGGATSQREILVGDFMRGCQLLDRMGATVMVGLNADDFTKNKRTILAEERVAFPIYAPAAFAHYQTQAFST